MASPLKTLLKLFKRKNPPPLACHLSLDQDENHVHTSACFLDVQPLALAEIFQSQGCKACPPALPTIIEATQNPNLQVLTYDVTFFDHLGWQDTHGNPRWDERLKQYVKKWGRNSLYTPMVVVNGVADGGSGGGSKTEIDGVVQRAREMAHGMDWHIYLDANDSHVKIDSDKLEAARHDVLVIVYEDKTEVVKVASAQYVYNPPHLFATRPLFAVYIIVLLICGSRNRAKDRTKARNFHIRTSSRRLSRLANGRAET